MKQSIFSLVLCLLLLSVAIEANILPIVNTTTICSSLQPCTLRWTDDANLPSLATLQQNITIELMTGPNKNQIPVMNLGSFSPLAGIATYDIPDTLGPTGKFYFYKFTSGVDVVWSGRFIIEDISGTIPGFDPTTINGNGDIISKNSTVNLTNATNLANSTSPANSTDTKSASSILSANTVTTVGLSMMVAISYLI